LLGLAFGMDGKELGFQMNRVKAKELLERIAQPA
jgi:heterodisulfide reductase subunit B